MENKINNHNHLARVSKEPGIYGGEELKKSESAFEILDPRRLPEIAFQSYEQFKNNSSALRDSFINNEFRNPDLEYPAFKQDGYLEGQFSNLADAKERILQAESDPFRRDVIMNTLSYRMAEVSYVQKLAQLNTNPAANPEDLKGQVEGIRRLGEVLYGTPDPEVVDGILNTIWQKLDHKQWSESGKKLYEELKHGFDFGGSRIDGLPTANDEQILLPEASDELMAWAGDYILNMNADLEALVRELWDQKVEQYGDDYQAAPSEIIEFFENALALRDPEGKSGVSIKLDPGASASSWNSSELAVLVGENRKPVSSAQAMFKLVLHELGVHGQRAINGFKTELPVLGSGLFTETERADYLTFEEGFAKILEDAVSNEKVDWSPANMGLYLNVALAERGLDFREIYELTWRYRVLNSLKDNQEVTGEILQKHKQAAYGAVVRVFRGTPTNLSESSEEIKPLTYNKDLAYLNGKLLVTKYFKQAWQDNKNTKMLDSLFLAKFDPTIEQQRQIVEQAFAL